MISPTSDNRIRLSRRILNEAGFAPGDTISIIRDSQNAFLIMSPKHVPRNTNSILYRVEQDGRARISNSVLRTMGVRARRKNPAVSVIGVSRHEKQIRIAI